MPNKTETTTKKRSGFTRISNRLLDHLLAEPCLCCQDIYKDKIALLKKQLKEARRVKR